MPWDTKNNLRVAATIQDSGSSDAFGRLRVSQPENVFDQQLTYDLAPLIYEQITAGSGASIAHDATNRCATMTFSSTPSGGAAYMQSYESFRYQPGKSQSIFLTFNMNGGVANVLKFAGYSDGTNGIEFQLNGTTPRIAVLSATGNGNEIINQAFWNLDRLDGSGPSKVTADFSMTQILCIDFQALYTGRVRVGFDIEGSVIYVHEFDHANLVASPYIQSANLPVRCGMTCTGTVSTTMKFVCCAVSSEGGSDDIAGYGFSAQGNAALPTGTTTHLLSVRPKTTFNSIANRSKFILESVEIVNTGTNPIIWQLVVGQDISGTTTALAYTDANTTYSAFEYNASATASGAASIVVSRGYISGTTQNRGSVSQKISTKYPISLNASGANRLLGTVSVCLTATGGNSKGICSMNWREIR